MEELSMNDETTLGDAVRIFVAIVAILGIIGIIGFGISFVYRNYSIWSEGMRGQAELAHAEWNRQISVKEAIAKRDSAEMLSQAEIIRARGMAEANKIIGDSLKNNEKYLQYLWVQTLDHSTNKIIYIPTEANLPILEAGRNLGK